MKKTTLFYLAILSLFSACNPATTQLATTRQISELDGMTLLFVSAGEFKMGIDVGWGDEEPAHIVYLDSFWIDQTEVTNDQYRLCVKAGACPLPGNTGSYDDPAYGKHPVEYVNWFEANTYCAWAKRRLPTEAEWEKAARGTDGRRFPWGEEEVDCSKATYFACKVWSKTSPVGTYPDSASPYGALDMSGNVWEWTADWYQEDYYRVSPSNNPKGPETGVDRALRSGSWHDLDGTMVTYCRGKSRPAHRRYSIGFRCALSG